jgi:hypothetical protein
MISTMPLDTGLPLGQNRDRCNVAGLDVIGGAATGFGAIIAAGGEAGPGLFGGVAAL